MKEELKRNRNMTILQMVLWIPLMVINIAQGDWVPVTLLVVIQLLLFRVYVADRFTIEYKQMTKDVLNDMDNIIKLMEREAKRKKESKRASTK